MGLTILVFCEAVYNREANQTFVKHETTHQHGPTARALE